MKLFLSSISIAEHNQNVFVELVGKEAKDIRVALIENGADTHPKNHREWVQQARVMIETTVGTGTITTFDLRKYRNSQTLENDLTDFDVVWVGGGNAFYLRWISRESGFDKAIKRLTQAGIVYGGDSAGAILAGPTISNFEPADTPEDAPEIILDGLGLTDIVILPHYDNPKYGPIMKDIQKKFKNDGSYKTIPLTDNQALVIRDDSYKIVG